MTLTRSRYSWTSQSRARARADTKSSRYNGTAKLFELRKAAPHGSYAHFFTSHTTRKEFQKEKNIIPKKDQFCENFKNEIFQMPLKRFLPNTLKVKLYFEFPIFLSPLHKSIKQAQQSNVTAIINSTTLIKSS